MYSYKNGFTIVELLIVIVVIAILAAITVVSYNGIQQRASNTKTADALEAWISAVYTYRTENGQYPNGWTCLGESYTYGPDAADSSGVAQCRQDVAGSGVVASVSFNNMMKPYLGNRLPSPTFLTAKNTDTQWQRGLMYAYGGGAGAEVYILAAYSGTLATCPTVRGITGSRSIWGGNTRCSYTLGFTTDAV